MVVRGGLSAAWSGFFYWSHDVGGITERDHRMAELINTIANRSQR